MNHIRRALVIACLLATLPAIAQQPQQVTAKVNPMQVDPHEYISRIKLPPGFTISIFAEGVMNAREMALSPNGTLFVGSFSFQEPRPDKVYALRDENGDHKADAVLTIASGLNSPNGVAFHDGDLYVAEVNRILRIDDVEKNLKQPPAPVVVNDSYPADFHHGWKFIAFGPDGRLYVPVGAPCNTCEPDQNHSLISSIKPDGTDKQIYARGIRNSVGFDWHPVTNELFFTDNGRDAWGNDRPPEELNHAPKPGLHFGFPYRFGKALVDDSFPTTMTDSDFTPAAVELPAHNAALGIEFYTGGMFPAEYRHQLFIASHGSWNRDPPDGYRIALARFTDNRAVSWEPFATGWLIDEKFWGRPVDIEQMPDGSLLVSDDFANVIYRITYTKPK
ncbi:MAG TPA: sorbosone dehydrogenase family protein [Gammaproteobacteria bacterium]